MSELVATIVGAVIGALAVYVLDLRKMRQERRMNAQEEERDRRRRRQAIATALLIDMRTLEFTLRRLYKDQTPGKWRGESPAVLSKTLLSEIIHFTPDTVYRVTEFFGLVRDTYGLIEVARGKEKVEDRLHHAIRCKAGFALQAMPPAKDALIGEGGMLPEPKAVEVVYAPDLPKIPDRCFPAVWAAGEEPEDT
jgi:hypothetical protein